MAKIQDCGNGCFVYIPTLVLKMKGWKKGTELMIAPDKNGDPVMKALDR